jgi:hypothetical protein
MLKNKRIYALSVLALLCSSPAHAAAPDPIAIVSWVGTELNNMVDTHIGLFVAEGQSVIGSILAILLVWYLMVGLFSRSIRNELIVELILNFMLCEMMLTFYDAPMPWGGGISFHQIFAKEAQWAAATLDISTINDVIKAVLAMWKGMVGPNPWDVFGVVIYVLNLSQLFIIWLLCSGITLIAHIALGFGALMGPLLIPFFIWPKLDWLFWGWVRFMTTYALYIISSSAVVFLYAHVVIYFFDHVINGDYSVANLTAIILPFLLLNGIFVIVFWQCHGWAKDLASGSASMGENVSGMVQAAATYFLV